MRKPKINSAGKEFRTYVEPVGSLAVLVNKEVE